MAKERQFDPAYTWQFSADYNSIIGLNENFRSFDSKLIEIENLEKSIPEIRNQFNKWSAHDLLHITNDQINKLEKRLEELSVKRMQLETSRQEIAGQVTYLAGKIFSFFQDIQKDYKQGYLTDSQYSGYLKKYKHMIDTGNGLEIYKCLTAGTILKEIAKMPITEVVA